MTPALTDGSRDAALRDLAPGGVLRAAINIANPVLARTNPGDRTPQGVSVDIAHELARALDCLILSYNTAGRVFAGLNGNEWDVAFLAIEPARAGKVIFSSPYVAIEGTYLVREETGFGSTEDLDCEGLRIAVALNAAYDLFLSRTLARGEIVRAATPMAALEMFAREGFDAAAGVRQALDAFAAEGPGFCVLPDSFTVIEQAMATPRGRDDGGRYLDKLIRQRKARLVGCAQRSTEMARQACRLQVLESHDWHGLSRRTHRRDR